MTCEYCGERIPDYRTQLVGCCIPGSYRNAKERVASVDGWYGDFKWEQVFDYVLNYPEKGT